MMAVKGNNRQWLRDLIGARMLNGERMHRNIPLLCLILVLGLLYIINRYESEHELLELDHLRRARTEAAYGAMTLRATYVERCRLSYIEEELSGLGEGVQITTSPLYRIK